MGKRLLPPAQEFIAKAKALGAADARIIAPAQVSTGEWVRLKCMFGCDGYGEHLTCPPYSPTPQQTRLVLDEYTTAVLIHVPSEPWTSVTPIILELERDAFLSGYYKAFGIGSGPCHICDTCVPAQGCRHRDKARPSMEACGIDVFATARAAGFPIEVVKDHGCPQNYYGLLLLE